MNRPALFIALAVSIAACGTSSPSSDAHADSSTSETSDAACACTRPNCSIDCDAAPPCAVTCHDAVLRWFDACGNEIYNYPCPVGCNDMTSPPHC